MTNPLIISYVTYGTVRMQLDTRMRVPGEKSWVQDMEGGFHNTKLVLINWYCIILWYRTTSALFKELREEFSMLQKNVKHLSEEQVDACI